MTDWTVFPETITTEEQLDDLMSRPYEQLVELMGRLEGDIAILGIAGKMGLTMGTALMRAIEQAGIKKKVYGVSRFSDKSAVTVLERSGIEPIKCDLMDRGSVGTLPRVPNVIFMAGRKFGTVGGEDLTWAMNTLAPANVCEQFVDSRIVAFSTGCVYPYLPNNHAGNVETDAPGPVGEYSQSCLGRERVFEYYARRRGTRVCLIRLNYALDLRYGVLYDIASAIWEEREVDRTVGVFNGIWQGDANNQALLALDLCGSPADILNVTGMEKANTTEIAEEFGRLLGKPVRFSGPSGNAALINNATRATTLYGEPRVPFQQVLKWTADWIRQGGRSLGKPTHFESADGKY